MSSLSTADDADGAANSRRSALAPRSCTCWRYSACVSSSGASFSFSVPVSVVAVAEICLVSTRGICWLDAVPQGLPLADVALAGAAILERAETPAPSCCVAQSVRTELKSEKATATQEMHRRACRACGATIVRGEGLPKGRARGKRKITENSWKGNGFKTRWMSTDIIRNKPSSFVPGFTAQRTRVKISQDLWHPCPALA